jgi:very-short-patch-repair endonuclease
MDALARRHCFTATDLTRQVSRYRRRRGVVQLRELAPLVRREAESLRESWVRLALLDFGLPEPELQWWVTIDGVPTYRLDLAYPHARIAIEYDGREHHTSPADRARDEQRRAWLRAQGWTVIVVCASDLTLDAGDAWLRAVREALAAAHRRPRRVYR